MKNFIQIILYPFSICYGTVILIRNYLFDYHLIRSERFPVPTICIGNINVGGTGKTPLTEYIIKVLLESGYKDIVTLSRGYGRKTKGYFIADENSTSDIIGDEPLQFHKKFPEIKVTVCENRVIGIKEILEKFPKTQCILLDDAFQHRRITAGINILLTDFHNPFFNDKLLPAGRLREHIRAKKRADIIVVTKTPQNLSEKEKEIFVTKLEPDSHQNVFFSFITYLAPVSFQGKQIFDMNDSEVVLFTGIANPRPLKSFIEENCKKVYFLKFPDHHVYREKDLKMILNIFTNIVSNHKAVLTTEKDFVRLANTPLFDNYKKLPFYYIPIEMDFFEKDKVLFHQILKNYVGKNS